MFFSPLTIVTDGFSMVSHPLTIIIECLFTDQPLKSMVFWWFFQIQVQWSAMVLTLTKAWKCA